MKKLITAAVASAFAFLAIGAGNYQPGGTSFESSPSGEKTVEALTAHEDDGVGTGDARYWIYGGGDTTAVVGVVTNGAPAVPSDVPSRPDQFADIANNQYLNLAECEATNVLYRAVKSVAGKTVETLDGESIGDGLYLDTLVKFTSPADSTNDFVLASGDKLAITYIEETEDDDGDGVLLSNIVVRAGYVVNGVATEKNYTMILPPDLQSTFAATNWHRLTVRAINVGYAAAPVGFVIYLDGCPAPLTYAVGEAAGDSTYTDALAVNAIVNQFLYNSTTHALLPSAVSSGTAKTTLAAVGFKGTGCIDDISFVSGTPGFVEEGKGVAIEWDSGVATVTVRDGDTYYVGSALGGEVVTNLAYSATNFTVESSVLSLTVTATYKQGVDGQYEAGTWVTDPAGKYSAATDTLVLEGDNTTLTINSMLPLFQVGETHYGTFAEALTAAVAAGTELSPATIKLLANYNNSISFSTGYIVLDLNGKTLQGGDSSYYTINNSGAELTIIDSASGGTVLAPTKVGAEGAFYTDAGLTTINAGTFESTVYTEKFQDPEATGDIVVNGGVFYDPDYDPDDEEAKFYLYDYLADGVKATYDAGYFTVGSDTPEPPAPTLIPVPTAATTLVYDGSEQTGVAAGEGYTLGGTYAATNAGEYEATATPDVGYAWSDGTTHTTNISWSIAKATVTATVSLTVTEATYDSTKTTVTDYTTPSLNFGLGAPALVENTDYTVGWSATEVSGAGTFTYTVSPVAESNYTFTEASVTLTITAGGSYPHYIPDNADMKSKYDTWKSYYSVADGDNNYDAAFLLNIAPDAPDQTLKAASITISGSTVTITANKALNTVNGNVYIKTAGTLAGLESASWSEVTADDTTGAIEMTSNGTAAFFKIKVDFAANNP